MIKFPKLWSDRAARKRATAFLVGQNRVLQMIAAGAPLEDTLDALVGVIESQAPDIRCAVLLLDEDGSRVRIGAAPSLPADYRRAIDAITAEPRAGSCSAAVLRGERVLVHDINTDPQWVDYRELALRHGLRACWSLPILGASKAVLGAMGCYAREPKSPDAHHLRLIETAARTAAIAVERARAEDSLRRSEAALEAAQERAKIGSWEMDMRTRRTTWSRQLYRLFDRDPSLRPPAAEQFFALIHPEDRPAVMAAYAGLGKLAAPRQLEFRTSPEQGAPRHFLALVDLVRDAEGAPRTAGGTIMDITERKHAEHLLRLEHTVARCLAASDDPDAALQAVIRAVCEAGDWECGRYWRVDERAGVLRFGAGWSVPGSGTERFIEQSRDLTFALGVGLAGRVWQSGEPIWAPDVTRDVRVFATHLSRDSGMHGAFVFPIIAEGRTIGVLAISSRRVREPDERLLQAVRVVGGQIGEFLARRRSDQAIREWKERYEAVIVASGHALYDWDARTGIVTYGGNLESTLGYAPAEIGGGVNRWLTLIHPDDARRFTDELTRSLREKAMFHLEYRVRHKDGRDIVVRDDGYPIFDAAGEVVRMIGFIVDVTEGKRIEEEHARLEAELRQSQKMQALGTLAGGIAHDFNNILMAITGNAKLALVDLPASHPAATCLTEIQKAGVRATSLVRQILAFSRREETARQVVDLAAVIGEAVDLLRATLPAKIEIRKRFAGDLPPVRADATQLHQVIMNLGANAAHAMTERGGVLEVAIEAVNLAAAALPAAPAMPPGRYLRLAVSDTGCGMDQATLERVFEPFFTTKPRGEGVGLGLSVVHGIMQGHEGAIDVASALGEGTVVNMYFPAVEVEGSALAPAAAAAETRGHGERVLYVDDEEALVYLADRTLTRLGYRVAGFTDPRQALQAFRARPEEFDAVVTDVSMPGMSGPELARELLQIRPGVPIVITSGFVRPEDVAAAKQLGIRDLILKPNTVEELGRVLDATLRAPARSENPV